MKNISALAIPKVRAKVLVFTLLLAVAIVLPMFIHSQFVTGPIVNATLFLAIVLLGPYEAVLVGLLPSAVALSSGLLPLPLAPMVPFIMISNAILIGLFYYLRSTSFTLGVIVASVCKFVFLYAIVTLLMNTMLQETLVSKLSIMMSWPQLVTALLGGAIAFGILKMLKKL